MDTHCTRHSHAWIARVPHGATRAQQAAHCRAQLKAELLIAPLITDWLQAGGAQSSQQRQSQQPSKTATTATCGERLRADHVRDRDLSSAAGGFLELWQWARVRVQSQAHRTKSRFRRPEAAQSRRVCKNLFLHEDLVASCWSLHTCARQGRARQSGVLSTGWTGYQETGVAHNIHQAGAKVGVLFGVRWTGGISPAAQPPAVQTIGVHGFETHGHPQV